MKLDAHYYATLGFCRLAGMDEALACRVAYACQYVDDATLNCIELLGDAPAGVATESVGGKEYFLNMATCHSYVDVPTFTYEAMIANTVAFHFVPRGPDALGSGNGEDSAGAVPYDGESRFTRMLVCHPESPIMKALVEDAVAQACPVYLGIVLHAYLDTFSHEGFSGLLSKANEVDSPTACGNMPDTWRDSAWDFVQFTRHVLKKDPRKWIPSYGHARALDYPDYPYLTWTCRRDRSPLFAGDMVEETIRNQPRFRAAFEGLLGVVGRFLEKGGKAVERPPNADEVKEELFRTLLHRDGDKDRLKAWRMALVHHGLLTAGSPPLEYRPASWFEQAFTGISPKKHKGRRSVAARPKPGIESSDWYAFYKAQRRYKERFFAECSKCGIPVPR